MFGARRPLSPLLKRLFPATFFVAGAKADLTDNADHLTRAFIQVGGEKALRNLYIDENVGEKFGLLGIRHISARD